MCATRKVSDLWMSRAARASAFHWNLIGIQVPRREGCLDSHLLLPSPWGGSFSTRAFLHARRVAEFRGRRDVPLFWNPSRGRKRFRLGSLPESHREKRDPSSKATRSFYRLCLPLLVSISTERRSIDQGKKKKKKKKIRGARLELNRINLWDCCARVSNN